MRKSLMSFLLLAMGIFLFFPLDAKAVLVTIDFDDLSDGTILTNQYSDLGVIFSAYNVLDHDTEIVANDGMIKQTNNYVFNYMMVEFLVPVDFVSIDMRGYSSTGGTLSLALFDASGNSITGANADVDDDNFITLTGQSSSIYIDYITMYGVMTTGDYAGESFTPIYDNLVFNTVAPIPEPTTMLLLSVGLVGVVRFRKRFNKS